ncbi:radical SAM/SPASM domain-containing protein [Candidatus Omnitrophota bacterium]
MPTTNRPKYCGILITDNCMLRCKMCQMWESKRNPGELTAAEWKTTFSTLKGILDPQAEICFTGGEPLLRKDILELIRFVSDSGLRTGLNTNAYCLDEETAKSIAASGLWSITISLESLDEERHDFIRGRQGSQRRVMDAIESLSRHCNGLYIGISTVICDTNIDDIIELAQWVQKSKRINSIRFQALMQPLQTPEDENWHRDQRYNHLWPKDSDKAESVLRALIELKEKGGLEKLNNPVAQLRVFQAYFRNPRLLPSTRKCIFGHEVININHLGDISLCPELASLGNVKDADITGLWHSDRTERLQRQIKDCKKSCKFSVNCFWE